MLMAKVIGEPGRMSALVHNPTIEVRRVLARMRLAHCEGSLGNASVGDRIMDTGGLAPSGGKLHL
jgi:hypothetical protein